MKRVCKPKKYQSFPCGSRRMRPWRVLLLGPDRRFVFLRTGRHGLVFWGGLQSRGVRNFAEDASVACSERRSATDLAKSFTRDVLRSASDSRNSCVRGPGKMNLVACRHTRRIAVRWRSAREGGRAIPTVFGFHPRCAYRRDAALVLIPGCVFCATRHCDFCARVARKGFVNEFVRPLCSTCA